MLSLFKGDCFYLFSSLWKGVELISWNLLFHFNNIYNINIIICESGLTDTMTENENKYGFIEWHMDPAFVYAEIKTRLTRHCQWVSGGADRISNILRFMIEILWFFNHSVTLFCLKCTHWFLSLKQDQFTWEAKLHRILKEKLQFYHYLQIFMKFQTWMLHFLWKMTSKSSHLSQCHFMLYMETYFHNWIKI